jgi:hypothetical protein
MSYMSVAWFRGGSASAQIPERPGLRAKAQQSQLCIEETAAWDNRAGEGRQQFN